MALPALDRLLVGQRGSELCWPPVQRSAVDPAKRRRWVASSVRQRHWRAMAPEAGEGAAQRGNRRPLDRFERSGGNSPLQRGSPGLVWWVQRQQRCRHPAPGAAPAREVGAKRGSSQPNQDARYASQVSLEHRLAECEGSQGQHLNERSHAYSPRSSAGTRQPASFGQSLNWCACARGVTSVSHGRIRSAMRCWEGVCAAICHAPVRQANTRGAWQGRATWPRT